MPSNNQYQEWLLYQNRTQDLSFKKNLLAAALGAAITPITTGIQRELMKPPTAQVSQEQIDPRLEGLSNKEGKDARGAEQKHYDFYNQGLAPINHMYAPEYYKALKFIHGGSLHGPIYDQLTMPKERLEEAGKQFLKNYTKRYKLPPIDKTPERQSYYDAGTGRISLTSMKDDPVYYTFNDPGHKKTIYNTLLHEFNHNLQDRYRTRDIDQHKELWPELIGMYDAAAAVANDMWVREQMGLDPEHDEHGQPLYSKPIQLPNGGTITALELGKLARNAGISPDNPNPPSANKLLEYGVRTGQIPQWLFGRNWKYITNNAKQLASNVEDYKESKLHDAPPIEKEELMKLTPLQWREKYIQNHMKDMEQINAKKY